MTKTTANNPNGNVQWKLPGRMAERSKAPDTRRLLDRDFWYKKFFLQECGWVENPLLSEQKYQNDAFREMQFFAMTKLVLVDPLTILKIVSEKNLYRELQKVREDTIK